MLLLRFEYKHYYRRRKSFVTGPMENVEHRHKSRESRIGEIFLVLTNEFEKGSVTLQFVKGCSDFLISSKTFFS